MLFFCAAWMEKTGKINLYLLMKEITEYNKNHLLSYRERRGDWGGKI